jgi:hypothetical protein
MALLGAKQKIGQVDADRLVLPPLLYLDAAKRGRAEIAQENGLVFWAVLCQCLGSQVGSKFFYDLGCKAALALAKACRRQTQYLALTTGEYVVLKQMMSTYLRALPNIEVGAFAVSCQRAEDAIEKLKREAGDA